MPRRVVLPLAAAALLAACDERSVTADKDASMPAKAGNPAAQKARIDATLTTKVKAGK